jgi:hypothetical protein
LYPKSNWFSAWTQSDAPTGGVTGAVKYSLRQKCYVVHYIYRVGKSALRNNYGFLQLQDLEFLLEVNMPSRAKHG